MRDGRAGVEDWLKSIGLGEYAQRFVENGVDLSTIPHLTEDDLKELGVLLGHRRKLLHAIGMLGAPVTGAPPPAVWPPDTALQRASPTAPTGALGVILLRLRKAEERHQPIAELFQNMAAELVHSRRGLVEICAPGGEFC